MSASPRKKFPTLHTAMECTSPPTAATTPTNSSSTPPSNISLQRASDNASPPTVPYTMDDMNTGINHIITEAMVREQLSGASPTNNNNNNSIPTPTTKDNKESPPQRILKGLSCGSGSYGQQLLLAPTNVMESVPVEDVKRWKEFRRKQKTIAAATEIDVDGFPVSEEYSSATAESHAESHDGGGEDGIPKQQLVLATSTSNSEVGTEIVSNTARYLAKQSNIMARQLMSSSEEGEEEDGKDDDDTEEWGPPLDVGDDWDSPLNDNDDGDQEEVVGIVEDYDIQNSGESHVVNDEGGIQPSLQSQQPLPLEAASSPKKEVPTMDEVHNFMNQLKQKSAVGRERNIKYSKSDDSNNNTDTYSSNSKLTSSPSKVAPHALHEESDIKPPTTTSSAEVHKSLIEHKERMRQQKLEGQRKRQEFDARLQLLRSQLHDEAVDARLQLLRSKLHEGGDDDDDGLIVPTSVCDDRVDAHQTVEQWEREVRENNNQQKQSSMPVLPGARWSGGLAVWSPSNGGGVGVSTMRSKPTPSPSRHDDSAPKQPQQQQQQDQSTPLQLLPPTGIGIDEDDFSFSPVDVDAVLGKSSGSSSMSLPNEGGQSSTECLELFSEAYGGEVKRSGTNDAVDDDQAKASKSSSSPAVKDSIMETYYSKGQSRIVNRPPKSPPPSSDASLPISNVSTAITEGDKGGGLGSGYVSGFGDKSLASSVNVELGYGVIGVDPPLGDDYDDSSEKEDESLLGKTVVGSKRRKRKSNSPWTSCETVEEQSKDGLKEDGSDVEDEGDEYRRDPSPVTLEPTSRDAPYERKQLDPDGIVWNDIDVVKREPRSSEPTTPSSIGRKTIDANLEEMGNDQVCPENIFSSKNDNLPPVTPRMTPQAKDGQLNSGHHFTPRSKKLPTPRATPRTARAANLSSKKFGFGSEDDSTDMSFKMNEKPLARRDNRVDEASDESSKGNINDDAQQNNASIVEKERDNEDVIETEQVENQILTKHTSIKDIQSKFESNTFGIDHLQKSLQNIREEKAVGASKIPVKANLLDSPRKDSNTPSRIHLVDRDLRAMSSLETDTHVSIEEYSLNKGVSDDNDATIGDSTLGAGTMDTKMALRYAKRLENLNESEDNSKENHEEEDTPSIVAQRRKAFENQAKGSIQNSQDRRSTLDTVGSQRDKRSLSSRRSHLNASKSEESRHVHKKPSQDYSSFSQKPSRDYSSVSQGKSSVVASIKERIAAYDGQNSTNGKPSPYRLSGQSQTFQIRVGGQVKSVSIQNSARRQGVTSLQKANSITTAGAAVGKEKTLPTRTLNQDKQIPNNSGEHRIQYGGASFPHNQPSSNQNEATGRQHRSEMPRVAPIDTRFDYHTHDDDDDGITLSPTISEVSGLTFETSLVAGGVPEEDVNEFERTMTPIARLRQKTQGNRFSYDHADAPTPRTSVQGNRPSRRDQIVSRIRESSSNGNLWQRRNVVTEVSHSTSGDASGKSRNATMGNSYSISSTQGKVAEKVATFDRPRGNERVNVSVGDRVAMMNRHSQHHKTRHRNSMSDQPSSSLATRDCIRVD